MPVRNRGPTIHAGCRSNPTDRMTCPRPPIEPAMRKAVRIHPDRAPAFRLRTAAPVGFGVPGCVEERPENFTDDCQAFKLQGEVPNNLRKLDDDSVTVNLRHLAYVVTAADHGSITRAGAALEVSPPALSAAIQGFERRYG